VLNVKFSDDPGTVRRAYLREVRKTHPDKGGSSAQFRIVQDAYDLLTLPRHEKSHEESTYTNSAHGEDDAQDEYHGRHDWWQYDWFRDRFRKWDQREDESFERDFGDAEETRKLKRAEGKCTGKDWMDRDTPATAGDDDVCHTCTESTPIDVKTAKKCGLNYREYESHPESHPEKRVTCWGCKNAHKSVLTKTMAMNKSWKGERGLGARLGKVLDGRHEVFSKLRREKKRFHHQLVTGAVDETRNSEYFWIKDLQREAEKFPPFPRKHKREVKKEKGQSAPSSPPRKKHAARAPTTPVKKEAKR
tara:strand:- start:74 stop:985 length:912 start_codon:yes stop_codon:yes gene_type:complete